MRIDVVFQVCLNQSRHDDEGLPHQKGEQAFHDAHSKDDQTVYQQGFFQWL